MATDSQYSQSSRNGPKMLAEGKLRLGLAGGGQLRWAVADLTAIVETLRARRDFSPVAAVALGQMLTGAALVLRLQNKTPVRMILETRGDGPLGRVMAEANESGHLRGSVTVPQAQSPKGRGDLDTVGAIGEGTLRVIRQMKNNTYESLVPLRAEGGVSHQLTHFLQQSDQTRSALLVGVLVKPGGVAAAGGMILEALPGADDDLVRLLEDSLENLPSVSRRLEESGTEGLLDEVLGQLDRKTLETLPLAYSCSCDRDRLRLHLTHLPAEDRDHLLEVRGEEPGRSTEVDCNFCGAHYRFSAEELSIPQ